MKDGFALGVDRSLPGHPTYSMQEDNEGTSSEAMAYIGEYAQLTPFAKKLYCTNKGFCLYIIVDHHARSMHTAPPDVCIRLASISNLCALCTYMCAVVVEAKEIRQLKLIRTLL